MHKVVPQSLDLSYGLNRLPYVGNDLLTLQATFSTRILLVLTLMCLQEQYLVKFHVSSLLLRLQDAKIWL